MNNLLILVDSIGPKKELFAHGIAERLPENSRVYLARFSDLIFYIDGKNISIRIDGLNKDITDFNLVYFRRAGTKYFSLAGTLAICLDYLGIPFFDTTFSQVGPDEDKFTNLVRLSLAGLPTFPTYFCWHNMIDKKKTDIATQLEFPLIAKQLSSHRGKGIYLLKTRDDFKKLSVDFPDGEFMFQKYYPAKNEFRVLVLKEKIGAYEEKIAQGKEWRSNVALGAKEEFIDIKKIPDNYRKISTEAAKTLNIQIAGVDILVGKDEKVWLLEVNRGPGLTYDDDASPEIANLASFFAEELGKK